MVLQFFTLILTLRIFYKKNITQHFIISILRISKIDKDLAPGGQLNWQVP
jgi:hypothetical protein